MALFLPRHSSYIYNMSSPISFIQLVFVKYLLCVIPHSWYYRENKNEGGEKKKKKPCPQEVSTLAMEIKCLDNLGEKGQPCKYYKRDCRKLGEYLERGPLSDSWKDDGGFMNVSTRSLVATTALTEDREAAFLSFRLVGSARGGLCSKMGLQCWNLEARGSRRDPITQREG